MMATPFDLQDLRRRLDAIDDGLHDLLIERAEVVSLVAEHKSRNNLAFYQPDREAEIIRRLVGRHRGKLPAVSLVRIWREILAAAVGLEAPFRVAVYEPAGSPGCWDLARDHYGSAASITAYGSTAEIIGAVAAAPESAGVLPMPQPGEADPWWRHLLASDRALPRILARLPFGPRGNARPAGADALVIGHGAQRQTGQDCTLFSVETEGIGGDRIADMLAAFGLACTFLAAAKEADGAVHLIELDGFVTPTDARIDGFRKRLGPVLRRLLPLGGYALPLTLATAAPVARGATGPAVGARARTR